jgi:hypothetical protein
LLMGFLTVGLFNGQDILRDKNWQNWTISDTTNEPRLI